MAATKTPVTKTAVFQVGVAALQPGDGVRQGRPTRLWRVERVDESADRGSGLGVRLIDKLPVVPERVWLSDLLRQGPVTCWRSREAQ